MPSSQPTTKNRRSGANRMVQLLLILLFLALFKPARSQFQFQLDGPQPCPENPIRLMARRQAQYIYSPFDEHRLYPPDTDCQFLIETIDKSHRIHLAILESEMEEALFTECNDFVSVRDGEGNEGSAKEVVRWCGQDFPAAITSAGDSLLVHFHSDSVIQKRGFNISFLSFALPGCPPEWDSDVSSPFCYKQFVLPHILPWFDAQKECNFEQSNLAVFQDDGNYAFVVEKFSQTHSFPWIGYSDANVEGVFEAADRSSPLWPENFPLRQENEMKDCVYLDWNKRDQIVHYEIDDCRNRRPFLCKKRKDGTELPVVLPSGMVRRGFRDFSLDYTLLLGVIVLLLLALVVACVLYQKFKERSNRVVNVDLNQRLVQQQQQQLQGSVSSAIGSKQTLVAGSRSKSRSAQKAAEDLAKENERREREQKYEQRSGKNAAVGAYQPSRTAPKPLETQDSAASFPLQTFQGFSRSMHQIEMESNQRREARNAAESPAQSPRISLSPNQPEMEEKRGETGGEEAKRKGPKEEEEREEEEEEEERHNRGYEPDSEEEEDSGRRGQMEGGGGGGREEFGERAEQEVHFQQEEEEQQQLEEGREFVKEKEEMEGTALEGVDLLGKFAQSKPAPSADHPLRPAIEPLRREEREEKEEGEGAHREGTMFSTGVESGTGTGGTPGTRLRSRRKSFDRPAPVGPLDSVSAISLDEFWQQNQK